MPSYEPLPLLHYVLATVACANMIRTCLPFLRRGIFFLQSGTFEAPAGSEAEPITAKTVFLVLCNILTAVLFTYQAYKAEQISKRRAEEEAQRKSDEARGVIPSMEISADGKSYRRVGETTEKPPERLARLAKYANEHINEL